MNFQELDSLLTHGSRVKPKNVPENPDSKPTLVSKPAQGGQDKAVSQSKATQKGSKKNTKIQEELAVEEGVSKPQDKYKDLQKKTV